MARPAADATHTPLTTSEITCPQCRARYKERMPTDACVYFYDCRCCGATLKPKAGDCCVFCSYGSVPCPPVQLAGKGGPAGAENRGEPANARPGGANERS